MRVAESCVGDQTAVFVSAPFREFLRPSFQEQLPRPRRRRLLPVVLGRIRHGSGSLARGLSPAIAVDDDVAQKREQLRGAGRGAA